MASLPSTLSILPLPGEAVLLPGGTYSIPLSTRYSARLVRSLVKDAASSSTLIGSGSSATSSIVLGCVPLRARSTLSNTDGDASDPMPASESKQDEGAGGDEGEVGEKGEKGLQVAIRLPQEDGTKSRVALQDGRPKKEELFEYGCSARIVRLERVSGSIGGGLFIVVEGLARFSFNPSELDESASHYTAPVTSYDPAEAALPASHDPLLVSLRTASTAVLRTLTSSSILPPLFLRRLRSHIASLSLSSAPALTDAFLGALPVSPSTGLTYADKLLVLSLTDGVQRVEKGIELLSRVDEAVKLAKRIDQRVGQGQARQQRAQVLMQQLLAIRAELDELAAQGKNGAAGGTATAPRGRATSKRLPAFGNGGQEGEEDEEDDIAELEKKVHVKAFSDEARKVALKELKRLKKSPPQGAEHGVIRTYIETLLSMPWTAADATPLPKDVDFLAKARQKLDEDHYGLDKIKKRLLEWLAVLRLQQQQDERDAAAAPSPSAPTPSSPTESAVSTLSPSTETAVLLHDATIPADRPVPPGPSPAASPPKPSHPAPILLLHGPPGVGKTSIARSLAEAMGRKFVRISLGGVRDEAEVRGHRRTYVGAMPGKVVDALRKSGTSNPVVLLDEIDKIGHDSHRGAPDAALLEVLDPSQNDSFTDHYLGVPIDLSQVLFIATANNLETIPGPLYDRLEAIEVSGYVHEEKLHIARQSLLPKQLRAHALTPELVTLSDSTLLHIITHYTREAGVRSLDRQLAAVCRGKAVEYEESREGQGAGEYRAEVTEEDLERMLGATRYDPEELDREGNRVGVATGLAYMGSGNGGILHIETTHYAGSGKLLTTGSLGEVISESAQVAFAFVKAHAVELGIAKSSVGGGVENPFKGIDVHLHLPSGAVKKDGPSAGVAMVVALVSLMTGIPTVHGIGMTGEVTLRGAVTAVGGIKEKVLAAHRASLTHLLLPRRNKRDVDADVPESVKGEMRFTYVDRVEEAVEVAFGGKVRWTEKEREKGRGWMESRL